MLRDSVNIGRPVSESRVRSFIAITVSCCPRRAELPPLSSRMPAELTPATLQNNGSEESLAEFSPSSSTTLSSPTSGESVLPLGCCSDGDVLPWKTLTAEIKDWTFETIEAEV